MVTEATRTRLAAAVSGFLLERSIPADSIDVRETELFGWYGVRLDTSRWAHQHPSRRFLTFLVCLTDSDVVEVELTDGAW